MTKKKRYEVMFYNFSLILVQYLVQLEYLRELC
ncbi:unnamed protein product [Acanthoscelides obtectus]|uniref:Uncharacterized protein n=1 Tax=Acanthoscelides obtectus TaxID=200917 RepID=A0A9P0KUH8_ACAOB|nr:unnamed protein product [Acanthoscelides obtectus]CAK1660096.1 hypothetical protein AOBTE_LOCUS21859 [Acanthoscelides obtectus]